jgi:hypothetical protein
MKNVIRLVPRSEFARHLFLPSSEGYSDVVFLKIEQQNGRREEAVCSRVVKIKIRLLYHPRFSVHHELIRLNLLRNTVPVATFARCGVLVRNSFFHRITNTSIFIILFGMFVGI